MLTERFLFHTEFCEPCSVACVLYSSARDDCRARPSTAVRFAGRSFGLQAITAPRRAPRLTTIWSSSSTCAVLSRAALFRALMAPLRWQVLAACEREFGLLMPHASLDGVRTVEEAADYWVARHEAVAESARAHAEHWTRVHPSNVLVEREGEERGPEVLAEWMREHTEWHPPEPTDEAATEAETEDRVPF